MKSIISYIRNLIGYGDEVLHRSSVKRDRDDDLSIDDEVPAIKKHKSLRSTVFPDIMSSTGNWERGHRNISNVRYVPIQVEEGYPSTSTPMDSAQRMRSVPIRRVDQPDSYRTQKPRVHTPKQLVVENDPDEFAWVEPKTHEYNKKKSSPIFINLEEDDDDDNHQQDGNDVIYLKKVSSPTVASTSRPNKFFLTKNTNLNNIVTLSDDEIDDDDDDTPQFYRLQRKTDNLGRHSPRSYAKFKTPAGITKAYKQKNPPQFAKMLQPIKSSNLGQSLFRNRCTVNGNTRQTLSSAFNLDEKKLYQELIKQSLRSPKLNFVTRPLEIINLADDSASLRSTQKSQRNALNEIRLLEKGLVDEKAQERTREYDPITVASINSSDSEVEVVGGSETSTSSSVRIDPVNTFKDSLKDRPITRNNWLADFDKKYNLKRKETEIKLREARKESDFIGKINHEQELDQLRRKLRTELSLPESLIEEEPEVEELPELTPEQLKLVNRALGPGPPGQLLIEKFNLRICRRDLQTLSGLNWLNDEVINFYMNLLMQRSQERTDLPKVYATNTFFYPKLMQSGQAGLRRWTRKVDIFEHDLVVIPVHLGVHWCLSLVEFNNKRVAYLDSMSGKNQGALDAIMQYLKDEHQDKKGQPFNDSGWKKECLKDIPQQMNGSDCGMFACTFAEFSSRRARYTFTQSDMPYLRRKVAYEILQGKLLL